MSDWRFVCMDLEANGFKPSHIFCICVTDLLTGETKEFTPETLAEGCLLLAQADFVVGHYIRGYDCPVIERLTDKLVTFRPESILDTLDMSKALTSNPKHSLKFWGTELGLPKLESPLFESYTPGMLVYCRRDVEITVKLFYHLVERYLASPREFKNSQALDRFIEAMLQHS